MRAVEKYKHAPPVADVEWDVAVVPVDAHENGVVSFAHDGFADGSDRRNRFPGTNLNRCLTIVRLCMNVCDYLYKCPQMQCLAAYR